MFKTENVTVLSMISYHAQIVQLAQFAMTGRSCQDPVLEIGCGVKSADKKGSRLSLLHNMRRMKQGLSLAWG